MARNGEGRGAGTDCSMWGSSSVAVECGDMVEMALRAPKWVQKGCRKAVRVWVDSGTGAPWTGRAARAAACAL